MEVIWYETATGKVPAREYLDALDKKMRSKTLRSIRFLQEYGHLLREPEAKHLRKGIFELRTTMGNNTGRVLFFFYLGDTAVLTHGFAKKSQKTPSSEISRAMRYRDDFLRRQQGVKL